MNGIAWAIVICEILFWVFIVSGLAARYIGKREKLGFALLAMTPLVDLALLGLTGYDLYKGSTATMAHGIAAIYIGVSIAYGKSMIRWADDQFCFYILKTRKKPAKKKGMAFAKQDFLNWLRHLFAFMIGAGLLFVLTIWVGDAERTEAFQQILRVWALVLGLDLLITLSYFIWPRPARHTT
jgi:hypothetical protein